MSLINRRHFLKIAGAVGLELPRGLGLSRPRASPAGQSLPAPKIQKRNRLGNTGLEVSDIGFGAINYYNPNVLRYAYDLGVNFFDTAEAYMRTMSETHLGRTLGDVRREIVLSSKYGVSGRGELERNALIGRVEGSLKRLRTDFLDIAMLHQVSDQSVLENEEVLAAFERLKADGKIRFAGFSTHVAETMLPPLLKNSSVDVVLFVYNHLEGASIESLIAATRAKGVGTIAMKALAGNKQGGLKSLVNERTKYSRAALGWVLANPHVDCCLITMNSFAHVEEYVAASGKPLARDSAEILVKYRSGAGKLYCRVGCRDCLSACPYGVPVNDVLRCAMYYEDYHMEMAAVELYGSLSSDFGHIPCRSCAAPCNEACPFGLPVREFLNRVHNLFAP